MGLTIKQLNYMITIILKIVVLLVFVIIDLISGITKGLVWILSGQNIFEETCYKGEVKEHFFVNTSAYFTKYLD